MLRRNFNFNDLFSDFDSLFDGIGSYKSNPLYIKGKKNVEHGDDKNGKWKKETFISDDGTYQVTTLYQYTDEPTTVETDETFTLKTQLSDAVEIQDYETAAKIRDQIKKIESNKEKIEEIKTKLDESIKSQEFESSIKYRDKLKKLNS
jgi:excinuclease UvrABC helicase subunit UvrB